MKDLKTRICIKCGKEYMSEQTGFLMCKECEKEHVLKTYGKSIKHCVVCDKPFEMKSNNSRYCSEECKKEARNLRVRERRRKEKKNKVKKCVYCSKAYEQKHGRQKYCSTECKLLAQRQSERNRVRTEIKRIVIKKAIENRPDLNDIKPKERGYEIRKYIVRTYPKPGQRIGFERDFNYFKPCKFDERNENLYYIHDFNDSDISSSLIKYTNTNLSEKEFENYNARGNLVFYEMIN